MNLPNRKLLKFLFFTSIFSLFICNFSFAKSKKDTNSSSQLKTTFSGNSDSEKLSGATKLPKNRKKSYFSKIDSEILLLVENGSPSSITKAMELMHKNESNYKEYEKVLIAVASKIMEIVWPSHPITWQQFEYSEITPYTEALVSVEKGLFDTSTGNTDYLSTILPALVVVKKSVTPNDIELCKNVMEQALKKYPYNENSVLANYILGVAYEKSNDFVNAQKQYEKVYKIEENVFENQMAYARILRTNGFVAQSMEVLSKINSQNSNNIELLKQNAYSAFDAGNLDLAETYVAKVLQQTPNDLSFVLFRAKILIEKNDYIHAISLLDMYERQNVESLEYLILRAKTQLNWSKNTNAALETVEKTLQIYPDNSDVLLLAASISSLTDAPVAGKYADELAGLVLQKDPKNVDALNFQLDGLIYHQNWQKAYETCSKLIDKENVKSDIVLKYVQICLKLNKVNEAYNFAQKKYKRNSSDENIIQAYVLAYSNFGKREDVLSFIDELIPKSSSKVKSNLFYQRSFLQKMEENKLADLRSSLIANPRNSESLFRLYEIYFEKQDYRKAQYYLKQVVAINPNDASMKKLNETLTKLIK